MGGDTMQTGGGTLGMEMGGDTIEVGTMVGGIIADVVSSVIVDCCSKQII